MLAKFVFISSACLSLGAIHFAHAAEPIDIGSRRELFVDRHLIDKLEGLRLRMHEPRSEGNVLSLDKPWEGPACAYTTILRDGDQYRLYYRGTTPDLKTEFTCVSTSSDGIHWEKPELGLVEFAGSKQNNLILGGQAECHAFAPMLDSRPGVPADERYKALGPVFPDRLTAWVSADGLRWKKMREEPVITGKTVPFKFTHLFDSQNLAFWSESEQCYVCYFRVWDGLRRIARTTSKDFLEWTPAVMMEHWHDDGTGPRPAPDEHLYTNATTPYYRAPHIYLALPSRFMDGRDAVSQETKKALGVDISYQPVGSGFNDVPLLSSRGGARYDRTFLEAFLRPGIGAKHWTSRANYPAWGIVPCSEDATRLAIYVDRHVGYPSAYVERLTMRVDGFVSVNATYSGGELVTKPMKFNGSRLSMNFSASAAGLVAVELQDAAGQPIPGHTLAECTNIVGDEIDRQVTWKSGGDVKSLAGQPVRLRFVMRDADLFSFQFAD